MEKETQYEDEKWKNVKNDNNIKYVIIKMKIKIKIKMKVYTSRQI